MAGESLSSDVFVSFVQLTAVAVAVQNGALRANPFWLGILIATFLSVPYYLKYSRKSRMKHEPNNDAPEKPVATPPVAQSTRASGPMPVIKTPPSSSSAPGSAQRSAVNRLALGESGLTGSASNLQMPVSSPAVVLPGSAYVDAL